tara:strand:- start:1762 stop:2601 length:840 start_codon:yes stop_codon:yes gene_type:complete
MRFARIYFLANSGGGGGATPSGIAYQLRVPVILNGSFATGDSPYYFSLGTFSRTLPVYPDTFSQIDYQAEQSAVRVTPATGTTATDSVSPTVLLSNNAFGNKLRFTDDIGNGSDAIIGSNIWAHVDWERHSFTGATSGYVIDHLTGFGYDTYYLTDGTFFNMNVTTADGQDWDAWMNAISSLGTHKTYTGWIPVDLSDEAALTQQVNTSTFWASDFFTFESTQGGASRGTIITGESVDSSNFLPFYDSSNADVVIGLGKAGSSSFVYRIANCFIKRKHY